MKNLKVTTALAAVTLAAATLATPLSAQAYDNNRKCADTSNGVLGAVVGGTAGAAIGDGIAGRGQSTELGILGAIIGGVAGAAIGDSASDCEKYDRYDNRQVVYPTTTSYPTTSYPTTSYPTTTYPATTNRTYTTTRPVYTPSRTVYTSPRIVSPAPVYTTSTSYGHRDDYRADRRAEKKAEKRLRKIDREIDDLRRERAQLKERRRYSHHYSPHIENRLDYIARCLDDLKRERKSIRKYGYNRHDNYRSRPSRSW